MGEKVIFLDRDGVINKFPGKGEYVKKWSEFQFLSGVFPSLRRLKEAGWRIFVISNQSGIGKGLYSQEELNSITQNMLCILKKEGIELDGTYFCPHKKEDACQCRKPNTGLLIRALYDARINKEMIDRSYFIGDSRRDMLAGKKFGCVTILVLGGEEEIEGIQAWGEKPDFIARDLEEASEYILQEERVHIQEKE